MTSIAIQAKGAVDLKAQIDALAATTINFVVVCNTKNEYLVFYTP